MKISGCSSCEAVQPARYQPAQRTQRGTAQNTTSAPISGGNSDGFVSSGIISRGRPAWGNRTQSTQPTAPPVAAKQTQSATAVQYQRSSSRAAEITITTAEGDKVTLSLAAQSEQTHSAYRAQGTGALGAPQNIRGGSNASQSSQSVKVGVEGDLSDKEVADIKKLIEAFGQLTQGDSSGIAQFSSLDSLATAKFAYSSTTQSGYGVVQVYA